MRSKNVTQKKIFFTLNMTVLAYRKHNNGLTT